MIQKLGYLFLALLAFTIVSCKSDSTGPDGGNNNQSFADRQGPDTTASWQSDLGSSSTSPWMLSSSVSNYYWQGGKLYAFGKFTSNGAGTPLRYMARVDTGGFQSMPGLTALDGTSIDSWDAFSFDGEKIHAQLHLTNYKTAFVTFDGAAWTGDGHSYEYGLSDFASTNASNYGTATVHFYDSIEVRKFVDTGMVTIKAHRNYDVKGLTGLGSNLYYARYPSNLWGSPVTYVDVFDGTNWSKLDDIDGATDHLKVINGQLYAMGWMNLYKGDCPARVWTGTEWADILADISSMNDELVDMDKDATGAYYFATKYKVYRYANNVTTLLGTTNGRVNALTVYKGRLIVSGSFSSVKGMDGKSVPSSGLAVFK